MKSNKGSKLELEDYVKNFLSKHMKGYKIHYVNEIGIHPPACGNMAANNYTTNPREVTCSVCWKICH